MLLAGDASVDSWFREIYVPRAWRAYLATRFAFREKKSWFWVHRSPLLPSATLVPEAFFNTIFFDLEICVAKR